MIAAAIQLAAGLGAMLGCLAVMLVAPTTRAARGRVRRPSWARTPLGARRYARTRVRAPQSRTAAQRPLWAHTNPDNYEDAA